MQDIIIAIQTPRAGKWNHRWIVPTNFHKEDTVLSDALNTFHSCDLEKCVSDGIIFSRIVIQPSSGREATESLFFYCKGFLEGIPDSFTQQECLEKIRVFFTNEVEGIVTSIDWENASSKMVHSSERLDSLFQEIQSIVDSKWIEIEKAEEIIAIDSPPPPPKEPIPIGKIAIFATIIALLFFVGVNFWTSTPSFKPPTDTNTNGINTVNTKPPVCDFTPDEYKNWCKLFTRLQDESEPAKQKELVQTAIDKTYEYYWGPSQYKGDECSMAKKNDGTYSSTFVKNLYALHDKGVKVFSMSQKGENINVLETVTDYENCFKDVNPEEFREILKEFQEHYDSFLRIIKRENEDEKQNGNLISECDTRVDEFKRIGYSWNCQIENQEVYPKFFFACILGSKEKTDCKLIQKLIEFYKFYTQNETVKRAMEDAKTNSALEEDYDKWEKYDKELKDLLQKVLKIDSNDNI